MKRSSAGFTVAEVVMVLLLMAAVAAVLVAPVQRLVEQLNVRPLETVVLTAVRDAHYLSRTRNESVFLMHVGDSNLLRIVSRDGVTLTDIPYATNDGETAARIRFYRVLPEDPERTGEAFEWEDDPVETILFHPVGVSVPFAIHMEQAGRSDRLIMDPFSSHILRREEEW